MVSDELSGFQNKAQPRQGDEISCFRKMVYNSQNWLPVKGASPVMNSKAMWDQGHPGIGKGWESTNGEELVIVF